MKTNYENKLKNEEKALLVKQKEIENSKLLLSEEEISQIVNKYNIDINAIAPGQMNTKMLDEILQAGPSIIGKKYYQHCLNSKKSSPSSAFLNDSFTIFSVFPKSKPSFLKKRSYELHVFFIIFHFYNNIVDINKYRCFFC